MKKGLLLVVSISFLVFFAIGESLKFALNGDDWLALWRYITVYTSFVSHFDIKNYSSNYDIANIIMGIIWRLFEFNPFPYYLISLISRILAALSFFLSVYTATRNKLAGVLSSIFFALMYAGIETTNWVFNLNTYISIVFLNLFICLHYSEKIDKWHFRYILQSLVIFFAFITAPTRMHGLIFFIPILLIVLNMPLNKKKIINTITGIFILLAPATLYRIFITKFGNSANLEVINIASDQVIGVFINIITNIGYAYMPNIFIKDINPNLNQAAFFTITGIFFLTVSFIYLITQLKNNTAVAKFGIISLYASISFLIIPSLVNPGSFFVSDHRYLIIPGGFLMSTLALILSSIYKNRRSFFKTISIAIIFLIIAINFSSLKKYFDFMKKNGRASEDVERIFKVVNNNIQGKKNNTPLVFLFTSDNYNYVYNAVNFGFTPHVLLVNPQFEVNNLQTAPFAVDNLESLKSIISNQNSPELKRYGYKPVKIPIENVYSFYLDSERILDYSHEVRKILIQ